MMPQAQIERGLRTRLSFHRWGLPLLAKELIELAARKRTYVVRSLYAAALVLFMLFVFYEELYQRSLYDPLQVLGKGRQIFDMLVGIQLAGIYTFMPALACGVVTHEKERNSLGLLFLTRLGPWTIVLEKYLSRLLPMASCLLLSLPIIGFTYALGGLSPADIWTGAWLLLLTAMQVGAFAVMCSCLFRTTTAAFIGTYVLGAMFYFGPVMAASFADEVVGVRGFWREFFNDVLRPLSGGADVFVQPFAIYLMQVPLFMLFDRWDPQPVLVCLRSLPTVISLLAFLCLARFWLVKRAFAQPQNLLLSLFNRVDSLFQRINRNRFTRGIVLLKEGASLPSDRPIAWRETHKKALGKFRYLLRMFLLIELPLLLFCAYVLLDSGGTRAIQSLALLNFCLWILAVLLVSVKSTSLIAGERTRDTLSVLLTTPLTTRRLIAEKMQGVWRLMLALAIPFGTLIVFQTMSRWPWLGNSNNYRSDLGSALFYFLGAPLTVAIYLPLAAWLSLAISLRLKSQGPAIVASLAAIVGWCVLPLVMLLLLFMMVRFSGEEGVLFLALSSPVTLVVLLEYALAANDMPLAIMALVMNSLWYGFCLMLARQYCLTNAARLLGRLE